MRRFIPFEFLPANFIKSRITHLCFATILIVFIVFHTKYQYRNVVNPYLENEDVPLEGIAINDTKGLIPGNPKNGIQDLHQIYKIIKMYYSINKKYPEETMAMIKDIKTNPYLYGINKLEDVFPAFENPDIQFADNGLARGASAKPKWHYFPYVVTNKRMDGTPIGGPMPPGTKDLLAYTDLYVHKNVRKFRDEGQTTNPVGFYIVLWADGKIEEIPYDKKLYILTDAHHFSDVFPNQVGIPANALTYDQFAQHWGAIQGAHGAPGAEGKNYLGKTKP